MTLITYSLLRKDNVNSTCHCYVILYELNIRLRIKRPNYTWYKRVQTERYPGYLVSLVFKILVSWWIVCFSIFQTADNNCRLFWFVFFFSNWSIFHHHYMIFKQTSLSSLLPVLSHRFTVIITSCSACIFTLSSVLMRISK